MMTKTAAIVFELLEVLGDLELMPAVDLLIGMSPVRTYVRIDRGGEVWTRGLLGCQKAEGSTRQGAQLRTVALGLRGSARRRRALP